LRTCRLHARRVLAPPPPPPPLITKTVHFGRYDRRESLSHQGDGAGDGDSDNEDEDFNGALAEF